MKIKVYTLPTCGYCKMTREFLRDKDIDFEEFNVEENYKFANEMVAKSGQRGTPVIDVDGVIIVGFNKNKIKEVLNIK